MTMINMRGLGFQFAEPLFANMRPTQESVGGLVEVLAKTGADGPAQILSIDSAIVISAAR